MTALPLTPPAIRAAVGPGAYARGEAYHREGRVADLWVDPFGSVVRGTVSGGGPTPYAVDVRLVNRSVIGTCTCPVGAQCKHVASVLLAALVRDQRAVRAGGVAVPAWERVMTVLVTQEPAGRRRSPNSSTAASRCS